MNQKCDNHKDIRYQIGKLGIFILVPVVAVLSNDPLNGTCFCWLAYIGCCQSPPLASSTTTVPPWCLCLALSKILGSKRRKRHSAVLLRQRGLFTAIWFELSLCNNTLLNKLFNTGPFLTVLLSSHIHPSHWWVLSGDIFSRLTFHMGRKN